MVIIRRRMKIDEVLIAWSHKISSIHIDLNYLNSFLQQINLPLISLTGSLVWVFLLDYVKCLGDYEEILNNCTVFLNNS